MSKYREWFLEQLQKTLLAGDKDRKWLEGELERMRTSELRRPSDIAVARLKRAMKRAGLLAKEPQKKAWRRPVHFGTAYEANPNFVPDWARDPSLLPKRPPVYRQAVRHG